MRLRVMRVQHKRLFERLRRLRVAAGAQEAGAATGQRVHGEFAAIPPVWRCELTLPVELSERLVDVVLCQANEAEHPVEAERGIPVASADLPILNGGALPQHGLSLAQMTTGNVDHGDLEMRKRKVGVEREHVRRRSQA